MGKWQSGAATPPPPEPGKTGIDPERVAIMGGSYGGYLAAILTEGTPDHVAVSPFLMPPISLSLTLVSTCILVRSVAIRNSVGV